MGLLDDAIREHLELKRRRGADPAEVEQAEHEALGPVRRDPFEHAPDELEAPAATQVAAYDQDEDGDRDGDGYEEEWDEDEAAGPEPEMAALEPEIAVPEPEAGEETRVIRFSNPPQPEPLEPEAEAPSLLPDDPADPARYAVEDPLSSPPPAPAAGDETVEYDVEEAFEVDAGPLEREPDILDEPYEREQAEPVEDAAGEPATEADTPADDDVLEETPEFLQDTPDHDRLWFEQRPPKDFDFDG
jgi:hypothetical protein